MWCLAAPFFEMDGDNPMETSTARKNTPLSARRLAWLAGVAGLGATVLLTSPSLVPNLPFATAATVAHAQNAQRPVGFADIVETVKPAVISVRIRSEASSRLMGLDGGNGTLPQG